MAETLQMALYRIEQLEREVKQIEARNEERDRERQALERKQLVWGVTFLGGVIVTLVSVIWAYRTVIFRGTA